MIADLTIAIPVKDEEINLPGCLTSIGSDFAQKVVVIDSGSTDRTKQIALEFGAEVVDFKWDGKFPKKRNWFLRNGNIKTKWILFLDADEYLTPAFKAELCTALRKDDKNGYILNYTINFLGKPLRGGYPLRKLALFKVGVGEYEHVDEERWSKLDMEIHEHPVINGPVGVIRNKIDHRDYRNISYYIYKHSEYAAWEAERYLQKVKTAAIDKKTTWQQRIKYRLVSSSLVGPAYFCGAYFFFGGFRDGARGFAFAILKASYFTQIYCRIKEQQNSNG